MSSHAMAGLATEFLIISILGIGALQASSPSLRVLLLGAIWYTGIEALRGLLFNIGEASPLASLVGLFIIIWLLHLTELLLVENHIVSGNGPLSRLHAAYKMLFNVRRTALIADPQQVPRQKEHSGGESQRPQFRNKHLIKASLLAGLFWTYSNALMAITVPVLSVAIQAWQSDLSFFSYTLQQLLSDFIARLILVTDFVLGTYMLDSIFHSLFALLFVSVLGLDSPEEWPDLWGSIVDTTSVRDFWAKFWHKLVQRTLVGLSSSLLRTFGVGSRGTAGRTLIPFLVFLLSGVVHGLTTWSLGFQCGWWADIAWFCAQFGVIILEDAVVSLARRNLSPKLTPKVRAAIGSTWTWGFLLYSVPKWQMAKTQC